MSELDDDDNHANYDDLPIKKNVRNNDAVLESRAQKEMLRLPHDNFPTQANRKRRQREEDEFGFVVRDTDTYRTRLNHEEEVSTFRLPTTEFTRRRAFRDSEGNSYSPAIESDELYQSLRKHGIVDKIDPTSSFVGFPKKKDVVVTSAEDGTKGELYGKVLLFSQLKGDGKLHKWPNGEIELIDPSTEQYLTGQVSKSLFKGKSKGGYVILKDVVAWGQISDPTEFYKNKRNKT